MKEKIHIVNSYFEIAQTVAKLLGGGFVVLALVLWAEGINLSQKGAAMAETLNLSFAGADPYPVRGIDYELEARIINEPNQPWRRHAIVANYGDTIEVRLKVIAAEIGDADYDSTQEHLSFMNTAGLTAPTVETTHKKVVLPDGTAADYMNDFSDERITYIAAGTYQLCHKDWLAGKSASTLSAYISGDTAARLVILTPYCGVPIRGIVMFFGLAVFCGLILPIVIDLARFKAFRRLQDA